MWAIFHEAPPWGATQHLSPSISSLCPLPPNTATMQNNWTDQRTKEMLKCCANCRVKCTRLDFIAPVKGQPGAMSAGETTHTTSAETMYPILCSSTGDSLQKRCYFCSHSGLYFLILPHLIPASSFFGCFLTVEVRPLLFELSPRDYLPKLLPLRPPKP